MSYTAAAGEVIDRARSVPSPLSFFTYMVFALTIMAVSLVVYSKLDTVLTQWCFVVLITAAIGIIGLVTYLILKKPSKLLYTKNELILLDKDFRDSKSSVLSSTNTTIDKV